jgi:hypothetical protein
MNGLRVTGMAKIISIQQEIELSLGLLNKEYDPFQMDLEWFKYELSIRTNGTREAGLPDSQTGRATAGCGNAHAATGKINRKDLFTLLSGLNDLIQSGQDLRYEPYDLNFYLEWRIETPHVYSIITWFDMALSPRGLNSRFPSAHIGFRFLADQDALDAFRSGLEMEFIGSTTAPTDLPPLIN